MSNQISTTEDELSNYVNEKIEVALSQLEFSLYSYLSGDYNHIEDKLGNNTQVLTSSSVAFPESLRIINMKDMFNLCVFLAKEFPNCAMFETGSTYFFGKGKDIDICVFTTLPLIEAVDKLDLDGWVAEFGEAYSLPDSDWCSLRKGKYNILLHTSADKFDKMKKAAEVCKYLADKRILEPDDKAARIQIHKIIRGETE